jgi:hypothetical protein
MAAINSLDEALPQVPTTSPLYGDRTSRVSFVSCHFPKRKSLEENMVSLPAWKDNPTRLCCHVSLQAAISPRKMGPPLEIVPTIDIETMMAVVCNVSQVIIVF